MKCIVWLFALWVSPSVQAPQTPSGTIIDPVIDYGVEYSFVEVHPSDVIAFGVRQNEPHLLYKIVLAPGASSPVTLFAGSSPAVEGGGGHTSDALLASFHTIYDVCFSPDGQYIYVVRDTGRVTRITILNPETPETCTGGKTEWWSVAVSSGNYISSCAVTPTELYILYEQEGTSDHHGGIEYAPISNYIPVFTNFHNHYANVYHSYKLRYHPISLRMYWNYRSHDGSVVGLKYRTTTLNFRILRLFRNG